MWHDLRNMNLNRRAKGGETMMGELLSLKSIPFFSPSLPAFLEKVQGFPPLQDYFNE